jgi:hypothetical protein
VAIVAATIQMPKAMIPIEIRNENAASMLASIPENAFSLKAASSKQKDRKADRMVVRQRTTHVVSLANNIMDADTQSELRMACGIVSGYSPPCSMVSKCRPVQRAGGFPEHEQY